MTLDMINGLFEFTGAIMLTFNVIALYKDKTLKGTHWGSTLYFACWGIFNLIYYPSLGQWWSFVGAITIVIVEIIWLSMIFYYKRYISMFEYYMYLVVLFIYMLSIIPIVRPRNGISLFDCDIKIILYILVCYIYISTSCINDFIHGGTSYFDIVIMFINMGALTTLATLFKEKTFLEYESEMLNL